LERDRRIPVTRIGNAACRRMPEDRDAGMLPSPDGSSFPVT
jgi:hypothetical protein